MRFVVHFPFSRLHPKRATANIAAALTVTAAMAGLAGIQSDAQAAPLAGTCQGQEFLFDGWYNATNQVNVEGVSANIRAEDGHLCSGRSDAGNTTSTWDMIQYGNGLAQVGFWRYPAWSGSDPQYFYEYGANNAGSPVGWHTGVPDGSTHRFWVQWVDTGCPSGIMGCFAFNIDTTRIAVSNFDPYAAWGNPFTQAGAWGMEFLGESHDPQTDIMGGSTGGVATVWDSAQAQDASSNNYRNFTCNLTRADDEASRYGLNGPGTGGCGTWSTYTIGAS
jgi:hypothetical protein